MSILKYSLAIGLMMFASLSYAQALETPQQEINGYETQQAANKDVNWPEAQMIFGDLIMQSPWESEFFARKSIADSMISIGLSAIGRSCSSRDGKKDCFCDGGCWRTESDCGCN